jgi:alkylated DNA repair dioxygenase AlkB
VAILSLISTYTMQFHSVADDRVVEVSLPARSLLLVEGEARYAWAHGIERKSDEDGVPRGRRISLAFSCAEDGPAPGRFIGVR